MNSILPEKLLASLQGLPGFEKTSFEAVHQHPAEIVSIRLNKGKPAIPFPLNDRVPWTTYGYYLEQRPSFTRDPLFHAGTYYVQEASGMFLEWALKQITDPARALRVLDLCAAPGGKSTILQSMIPEDSLLVSNEVIKSRISVLQQNMIRWGASNIIISNNDPAHFSKLKNYFDLILVDAPCSGSGLFRKDPLAAKEWSVDAVNHCRLRQQRILEDAWPALKKDGILIYSTCSYSKEENEDILDNLLANHEALSIPLNIAAEWNITESVSLKHKARGYRFYPDKLRGEGFFLSCIQKKDGDDFETSFNQIPKEKISRELESEALRILKPSATHRFFKNGDLLHAIPALLIKDYYFLKDMLFIKKAGVLLGKPAGNELIPEHELALSTIISPKIPFLTVNLENAIRYLRKEEMTTPFPSKGWTLVRYLNQNLGWIKSLENRVNNYYPKTWRILK